jgi:predicted glycosyltransferase
VKPGLLLYCQHSLGLGHAVRSLALAGALSGHFRVVLACGGELPDDLAHHDDVELIALPALASRNGRLVPRGPASLGEARRRRPALLLQTLRSLRPAALVVELFPFGRRRFADELVPLLEEARAQAPRPLVVSSVRDILVGRERAHDTVNCVLANHYLDAVLVHSDPRFARFEESFRPAIPLRVPVLHTGFVVKDEGRTESSRPGGLRVIVSAGGGLVGAPLLRAALEARPLLPPDLQLELVAGPFLPAGVWRELAAAAERAPGVRLHRFVPELGPLLRGASASVSQCGYNTAVELLRAGVPALVVPFAEGGEDEQERRAARLAGAGAVRVLAPERLEAKTLAAEILALLRFRPRPLDLDFSGASTSASLLAELVRDRTPAEAAV